MAGIPALVLCAHGTRHEAGRRTTLDLLDLVREALAGVEVRDAYVDVQEPTVADAVASAHAGGTGVVVVPLLLSAGYHVGVDVQRAVTPYPDAVSTGPLGPHALLAAVLESRLGEAGVDPDEPVVLAVAGSSRDATVVHGARMGNLLASRRQGPVAVGYLAKAEPSVAEAVGELRARTGRRVAAASYLVGPGFFQQLLEKQGADVVSAPLGADPRVVRVVLERYASGVAALAERTGDAAAPTGGVGADSDRPAPGLRRA